MWQTLESLSFYAQKTTCTVANRKKELLETELLHLL